jgi:hypothetical protein
MTRIAEHEAFWHFFCRLFLRVVFSMSLRSSRNLTGGRMKRMVLYMFLGTLAFFGCKKDDASSTQADQFANKLTLGTGISGFTIINESTTFYRVINSATVYWRLESAVDMAGSAVTIKIDKPSGSPYQSLSFSNPQSYGHIMLSSMAIPDTGTFRATGILTATNSTVASIDFVVR